MTATARIKELERQVAGLTEERDALKNDIESLCLSSGSSNMFSGNYFLTERVRAAEVQAQDKSKQLRALQAEYDNLQLQLDSLQASHQAQADSLAAGRAQVAALEADKHFFQAAAARTVTERDSLLEEVEGVRERLVRTELALGTAEARLEAESRAHREAEALAEHRQQQINQARAECEALRQELGSVNRQLRSSGEAVRRLEASAATLQAKLLQQQQDLERTRQQLQQFREAEGKLRVSLAGATANTAQLQGTVHGQAEQLEAIKGELAALQQRAAADSARAQFQEKELKAQLAAALEQVEDRSLELRGLKADLVTTQAQLEAHRVALQQHTTVSAAAAAAAAGVTHHENGSSKSSKNGKSNAPGKQRNGQRHLPAAGTEVAMAGSSRQDAAPTSSPSTATPSAATEPTSGSSEAVMPVDVSGLTGTASGDEPPSHTPSDPGQSLAPAPIRSRSTQLLEGARTSDLNMQHSEPTTPLSDADLAAAAAAAAGAVSDAADEMEQLRILRVMVHDLKVKLANAVQEKVEALLVAADHKAAVASVQADLAAARSELAQLHRSQRSHAVPSSPTPAGTQEGDHPLQSPGSQPMSTFSSYASRLAGLGSSLLSAAATATNFTTAHPTQPTLPRSMHGSPNPGATPTGSSASAAAAAEQGMRGTCGLGHDKPVFASLPRPSPGAMHTSPASSGPASMKGAGGDGRQREPHASILATAASGAAQQPWGGPTTAAGVAEARDAWSAGQGPAEGAPGLLHGSRADSRDLPLYEQPPGQGHSSAAPTQQQQVLMQQQQQQQQQEALNKAVDNVVKLVGEWRAHYQGLRAAAEVLLEPHADTAHKWAALDQLSRLHELLHRSRARLGLPPASPLVAEEQEGLAAGLAQLHPQIKTSLGRSSKAQVPSKAAVAAISSWDVELARELLDLADLGIQALEAYNRQEAYSNALRQD